MSLPRRVASTVHEAYETRSGLARLRTDVDALRQQVAALVGEKAILDGELAQARAALAASEEMHRELYPTGHFYSAVPSREHLVRHHDLIVGQDPLDVAGVDLRLDAQRLLLAELAPLVADVPFPDHASPQAGDGDASPWRYHFHNDYFSYGDGLFLHLLVRFLRPAKVIEVGSGFSSACLLDTSDAFLGGEVDLTFVEPHDERLRSLLRPGDDERVTVLNAEVQDVDLDVFRQLGPGDLLLIDTTHTVKAGGDVNRLFFDVLPVLAPGVVVHVHDIFPAFDYPFPWLEQGRAWAEAYLLRAFLQYNDSFEIVLWPAVMARIVPDLAVTFPKAVVNTGGSIYLRRRK